MINFTTDVQFMHNKPLNTKEQLPAVLDKPWQIIFPRSLVKQALFFAYFRADCYCSTNRKADASADRRFQSKTRKEIWDADVVNLKCFGMPLFWKTVMNLQK